MGWSLGFDKRWNRDIGYGVPAECDHPRCDRIIDRGLGYVCGGEPYGGDVGCGLYFCEQHRHRWRKGRSVCSRCVHYRLPYKAKPDLLRWVIWKLEDKSWAEWREKYADDVEKLKKTAVEAGRFQVQVARETLNAQYT